MSQVYFFKYFFRSVDNENKCKQNAADNEKIWEKNEKRWKKVSEAVLQLYNYHDKTKAAIRALAKKHKSSGGQIIEEKAPLTETEQESNRLDSIAEDALAAAGITVNDVADPDVSGLGARLVFLFLHNFIL